MINKLYLLQKYLNNFGFLSEAFVIETLVKFAKLTQGENTSLFEEAFPDTDPGERKVFADRFYEIFKFLKDDQMFREIISSFSSFDEIKKKIEECEEAVFSVQSTVEGLGLPANAANQQAKQYLYKFYDELGSSSFFDKLTLIQNKGDFFALLRTEKKKTDESKLEKYNLSADKIRGLSPKEIDWIIKVLDIAEAGGEAHSADDAIFMVKIFHKERGNFDKEIWQFDSYSAAQAYLDSKNEISEAAYMAGIESAAKSNDMSRVVFEDNRWKVVLIGSTIAGQYWRYATGADSNMCIGTLSNNLFANYSIKKGIDPYFIIDKINTSGSNPMRMFTLSTERDGYYGGEARIQTQEDQEGFNASTMTDANNVGINISKIKETLGPKYDEVSSAILGDANSREQTLGKQNANKINEIIQDKETALNNLKKVIYYLPEYTANKKDEQLLGFSIPELTRKLAELYAFSYPRKFIKNFFNKPEFEDLLETFWKEASKQELLYIGNAKVRLPDGLKFAGSLSIHRSEIIYLPEDLEVSGSLDLSNSRVGQLPDRLKVDGNLTLVGTDIVELPSGLKVGKRLNIKGLGLQKLPKDLEADIILVNDDETKNLLEDLRALSKKHIKSDYPQKFLQTYYNVDGFEDLTENFWDLIEIDKVYLEHSRVTELPDPFNFSGELNISYSNLTKLPDFLSVGGNLDLTNTLFRNDERFQLPREFMEIKGSLNASTLWNPIWPKKTIIHGDLFLLKDGEGSHPETNESIGDLLEIFGGHDHRYIRDFLDVRGKIVVGDSVYFDW